MAGWAAQRGGIISIFKTATRCARHCSHRSTRSVSLNSHRSLRGRASLHPISQMRRLRLRETKGLVGITQLVRGTARLQSGV